MLVSDVTGDLPKIIGNDERLYEGDLTLYFRTLFFRSLNLHNPYHNFRHMLHVLWLCHKACRYYQNELTSRQMRNLLITALFHDFDHPGHPHPGENDPDRINIRIAIAGLRRYIMPTDRDFRPTQASVYSSVLNGGAAEVSCGNSVQEGTHVGGARCSEHFLELPLRFQPSFHPGPETGLAGFGQPQLLATAIAAALFDRDKAVALQRQDVPAERGSVHHHLRGEGIDRHRAQSPQLRENRKLRRAQPARRQKLIVKLRNVPCGLAHGETVAVVRSRISGRYHHNVLLDTCASTLIYEQIRLNTRF
jgi:hypothetical protein